MTYHSGEADGMHMRRVLKRYDNGNGRRTSATRKIPGTGLAESDATPPCGRGYREVTRAMAHAWLSKD